MKNKYMSLLFLLFIFYPAMLFASDRVPVWILLLVTIIVSLVVGMVQILDEDSVTHWLRRNYKKKRG
jgi:hypothetical protein